MKINNLNWKATLLSFLVRHQPAQSTTTIFKSGVGGMLAIASVCLVAYLTDNVVLMAPFGATCVLLFSFPQSPLSQPINVVAGHVVSTFVGIILHSFLPAEWWALGLAVGLAIAVMAALRITHPPAGADPLVVFFIEPSWWTIFFPVAVGSIVLVLFAWLFHKLPQQTPYPLAIPKANNRN